MSRHTNNKYYSCQDIKQPQRATTKKGQQTEKRSHEGNKISRRNNIMS